MKKTCTIYVTPKIAEKWLQTNKANRKMNEARVRYLAGLLASKQWDDNGDRIRFARLGGDDYGQLLDGQHRLSAIVMSGVSVELDIVAGLSPEVMRSIDANMVRTSTTHLYFLGEANAGRISAALIRVHMYLTGRVGQHLYCSPQLTESLLKMHPDIRQSVMVAERWRKTRLASPAIIASTHYLFCTKDADLANKFWDKIATGRSMSDGDPCFYLRERLVKNTISKSKLPDLHIFALIIKAWNFARQGRPIFQLKFIDAEQFPVIQ